ncbi:MAG: hypothetical protein FIB01_04590 [Gemmatimonadetes bacterium]|nr:hypothetical protein [Gemmatimonadota bacterium]
MTRRSAQFRLPFVAALVVLTAAIIGCGKSGDSQASSDAAIGQDAAGAATASAANADAVARTGEKASIVVNGQVLSDELVAQLQRVYPVSIAPGRYWYDAVSGAWGREGEPVAGQMIPGLALGGPLAADASRGTSRVFINGRQLTDGEKLYLERLCLTPVLPGRYWVMANGVGGYEGGPAIFWLGQCPGLQQQGGGSGSSTRTYCDANGACTSSGVLGTITTAPY